MLVIVEKGKLGSSDYHIWDNDNREIACHKQDVVELMRKLRQELKKEKEKKPTKPSRMARRLLESFL